MPSVHQENNSIFDLSVNATSDSFKPQQSSRKTMADFRYKNRNYIDEEKDSLTALLNYPAKLKNYAEYMERLIFQERDAKRWYLSQIETLSHSFQKLERKNARLQHEIEYCNWACNRYRSERDEARQELSNYPELRNVRGLERRVNELRYELQQLTSKRDRYQTLHAENFHETEKLDIRNLREEIKVRDLKIAHLEGRFNIREKRTTGRNTPMNAVETADKQLLSELRKQLQQVFVKLKETQAELDETKTRLSKVMGDRLTDNNPNIADLSDKNRPIKLAERYAELYDNQWTEAFEVLHKHFQTEEETIETLREILQDAMLFCKSKGKTQMRNLQHVMEFSDIGQENGNVPTGMFKQLKDCRKAMSSITLINLYKLYIANLKQSTKRTLRIALDITPFVKECVEICWFMVIQDPPVVFAPMAARGSELDTDVYKPYTSNGTHVEYFVWPALLLHEGGPVLAKGVAQGYGRQSRKANVTPVNARRTADEKSQLLRRDSQFSRQVDSNSALRNRSSRNSHLLSDDRRRRQQVATVGPMQMETSRASY